MNITPSTSDSGPVGYTIMGDGPFETGARHGLSLSLVLLSRGSSLYRQEILDSLRPLGFGEIISVESHDPRLDAEAFLRLHPNLRFLLTHRDCSPGQQINLAMGEARGDLVLVLWDDLFLPETSLYPKVAKVLQEDQILCWVPELRARSGEDLPTVMTPTLHKKDLRLLALDDGPGEHPRSLYPFDYVGIYHRQRFKSTGGFDPAITSPYWQKADFGLRAHLWGEEICQLHGLKVNYLADRTPDDTTPDPGYRRFLLKNLLPAFHGDHAHLAFRDFFRFWRSSGLTLPAAWAEFRSLSRWVDEHRYRFRWDSRGLVELWGSSR